MTIRVPLSIAYLLEDTDLSGGVRVQLAQADALIARGHRVSIYTRGMPLRWRRSQAQWRHIENFSEVDAGGLDFVIGGFWTTVEPAYRIGGDRALHLCQGYEGQFAAYADLKPQIDATYRLPVPKLVVGRHLVPICESFGAPVVYIGQIVDEEFYRDGEPSEHQPLRVLLSGAAQIDIKGIEEGYGAAAHARSYGAAFELIRVSPWAPGHDEPVQELVSEFNVALTAEQMTRLVHSCDIFLGPNHREEGFGLPAAEAMAAGLPAVLTRIPSYLSFADRADFALFADEGDAASLGDQLLELLRDEELRRELRTRGHAVAEQFHSRQVIERLERYLLERRELLAASTGLTSQTPRPRR